LAWTQQSAPPAAAPASPAPEQQTPEITSHEENPTFKVKVNLVEVRVVVRDAQGKAVGNLNKDDFLLTDNGKPQVITRFSVEKAGDQPLIQHDQVAAVAPAEKAAQPAATPAVALPQRYIAFLFDDIHLRQSDLVQARNAAVRQMQSLRAVDRAAIFTTSGQGQLDFTDDRAQLVAALNRLVPRPTDAKGVTECPNISYYMADLIINREDLQATQMARQDAADCGASTTQGEIRGYAIRALTIGDQEVRLSLGVLRDVVRRISGMPGQRLIILVSPGFMNRDELQEQTQIGERALHSGVVISALDARGLYTDMPDVSETRNPSPTTAGKLQQYHTAELEFDSDILADFADATGGTFFHNNNDLDEGFRRLAAAPEFSYLLGFAPQNLKLDGHFHKLKVTLKKPASGVVQARKGYYAPKGTADPGEQAKQAIEDAVFSQEEVREIPVELHTQFFKASDDDAKLSVVVRMDVRHVHFRKADGRNNNDVTVVSAVFDRNGNFVSGSQKVLQLHLKDETLQGRLGSGITLKSSFDVKPGSYIVRLVVRDEDGQLATQNSAVQIP
jgi:VWFA-related protein